MGKGAASSRRGEVRVKVRLKSAGRVVDALFWSEIWVYVSGEENGVEIIIDKILNGIDGERLFAVSNKFRDLEIWGTPRNGEVQGSRLMTTKSVQILEKL